MATFWMVMDSMLTTPSPKIYESREQAIHSAKIYSNQNKRSFIVLEAIGSASFLHDPTVYNESNRMDH